MAPEIPISGKIKIIVKPNTKRMKFFVMMRKNRHTELLFPLLPKTTKQTLQLSSSLPD